MLRFGAGEARTLGAWARGRGVTRILVVAVTAATGVDAMATEAHAIRRRLNNTPRPVTRDEIAATGRRAF